MPMHYSDPTRAELPTALPDVEVFYFDGTAETIEATYARVPDADVPIESGWYWWPCFPGCLPDGDPIGPFDTEAEALADAQEGGE